MILNFLYVGLGGALGAVSRLGINEIVERISFTSFPLSTLLINVFGCFFIGLYLGINIPAKDSSYYFFYWFLRLIYNYVSIHTSNDNNV